MGEEIRRPALEALEGAEEADSSRDCQGEAGGSSLLSRGVCGGGRGRPRGQCLEASPGLDKRGGDVVRAPARASPALLPAGVHPADTLRSSHPPGRSQVGALGIHAGGGVWLREAPRTGAGTQFQD